MLNMPELIESRLSTVLPPKMPPKMPPKLPTNLTGSLSGGSKSTLAGLGLDLDLKPAPRTPLIDRHAGPERRSATSLEQRRMAQMLDAIDYGMLLLSGESTVVHINKAARRDLDARHPLQLQGNQLQPRQQADAAELHAALAGAAQRGLRRLLTLGSADDRVSVAVVPLAAVGHEARNAVLLVLGKRRMCEELTVDWFARSHGLSVAETVVIKGLCADLTPHQIAARQGVGLATIRTQIGSIRLKTGAGSIRALVRQVALLPPLVSALHGLAGGLQASRSSAGRLLNA